MSLKSNLTNNRPFASPWPWLIIAAIVGLLYLAVAYWQFGVLGFPLDDAWIHQTYARNLAEFGQMAFIPGIPSAGSTAPLWSFLLSIGYWLAIPFRVWAYGIGLLFLGLSGWTAMRLSLRLFPKHRWLGLFIGAFTLLEWHLTWAAMSGMETILFIWLSLFLFEQYLVIREVSIQAEPVRYTRYLTLGFLAGVLILTRPEGLGLIGLIGLDIALCWWQSQNDESFLSVIKRWVWIGGGLLLLILPYIFLHLQATGLPFPNTFYAKQVEYSVVRSYPLWWRLFGNIGPSVELVQGVFRVIFIGPQLLLLPGLATALWLTFKERRLNLIVIWMWWISYLLLYGLRLPVTYQHGRYQIPAIIWVILLGVWGTVRLLEAVPKEKLYLSVLGQTLRISITILLLAFIGVGAQAYGRDVRFIESEMVATAHWLADNTSTESLIAVHDIGAIGYFTQRPLLDLAGLITPEVIPIIRDEAALLQFIEEKEADYVVSFPSWY
ncbi:MAG: hypothetical protein AAF485_22600, partial [Chloroflexota bacterium]